MNATAAAVDVGVLVNDIHSQLNATRVAGIAEPHTVGELQRAIASANASGLSVAIAGGPTRWAASSSAKTASSSTPAR